MKSFQKLNLILLSCLVGVNASHAINLHIPTSNSGQYYLIGGGQDVAMPALDGSHITSIRLGGSVNTNLNCQGFNPTLSLANSLDNLKDSTNNAVNSVLSHLKASVGSFPLYLLSSEDPNLYEQINNHLLDAERQYSLSMKSCQAMKSDIDKGQNPYSNLATISSGNDWKYQMGVGGDINQAKKSVSQKNGTSGLPWVSTITNSQNAGGQGQPPIHIISDTAKAGFNSMLGRSDLTSEDPLNADEQNSRLATYWKSPADAVKWIVNVVGDQDVTTFSGGGVNSTPGYGLLPSNQTTATTVATTLAKIVSGEMPITRDNLVSVSAPGVAISPQAIYALQSDPKSEQGMLVNKVAQDVATARTVDEALLAKHVLEVGSQIPAIYAVKPAQDELSHAEKMITDDIQNMLSDLQIRRQLVSHTLAALVQGQQAKENAAGSIPRSTQTSQQVMQYGGISNDGE